MAVTLLLAWAIAACSPTPSLEIVASPTLAPARPRVTPYPTSLSRTIVTPKDEAEMVLVPAGEFTMGSMYMYDNQLPEHQRYLRDFYLDKHEVTNLRYQRFVAEAKHPAPAFQADWAAPYSWEGEAFPLGKGDHPVVLVSWYDAQVYCRWAGKRLPSEAEWEKAARGPEGRLWPWGNGPDTSRLNSWEEGPGGTTPVGSYPQGASPYGAMDMGGNVWEWTSDWFDRYPGSTLPNPYFGRTYKVARGSSWGNVLKYARGSNRHWVEPETISILTGFRCALSYPFPPNVMVEPAPRS